MLRKILKVSGIVLAVVIIASGLFLAHTWYFKPININLFFARTMLQSPEMLNDLHVLEPLANTGMAESDMVVEIERYFVMSGQATAYKVGMIKILELGDFARAELGDRFDIREFHNVVLTNGSVPLDILEQLVREYVTAKKG